MRAPRIERRDILKLGATAAFAWSAAATPRAQIVKEKDPKDPQLTEFEVEIPGLPNCFPVHYSTVGFDTSSTTKVETITIKVGRVEPA